MSGLTIKQERFAREYVKDGNGTRAAIKAGYSRKSSKVIASQTLTKVNVSEAIAKLRRRQAERLDVSRDKLINDVAHIAEQAQIEGEYNAAINANTLIMKAQGYLVERQLNMSVDITQSHLEALQQYTDRRIDDAVSQVREEMRGANAGPITDLDAEETS